MLKRERKEMTERDFCYWLQGFSEITNQVPTVEEWKIIQDHLALVFNKVTPTYYNVTSTAPAGGWGSDALKGFHTGTGIVEHMEIKGTC